MRNIGAWVLGAAMMLAAGAAGAGEEPVTWSLKAVLSRVPPLTNDAAGRLPMITWPAFVLDENDKSFQEKKPLPADMYRELARRGLTQRIPLKPEYLPMALAIQEAGAAVIFVEGWGGNGPYDLAPNPRHLLPEGFQIPEKGTHFVCPALFEGWQRKADEVRRILRQYKEAGIRLTGAWLDWECEPWVWSSALRWEQARACSRCLATLPPGALDTRERYVATIMDLRANLFSTYLAAPVLEIYPDCSVTDWEKVISTPERPTSSCWGTWLFPPMSLGLFTAANPVAYGNDIYYSHHWKAEWNYPLDVPHMDRLYTHIMFGQTSHHAANAEKWAPAKQCIPWVCRYCPDVDDDKIPILSRPRYREILRHLWLRGADSMQIFNEPRRKHPAIAVEEVEDAVAVYDEMLVHRAFLERGTIMNTDVPAVTDDGAVWSGLQLGTQALVRAFTQGPKPAAFSIVPWGRSVALEAPPEGAMFRITTDGDKDTTERLR